ncbi:aminodeoxychorismate/anthranilate synthase component II [Alteromonas aestuariivivens]|uniref:Aminodeoxychorismate/anthranilate synthase component II n=1 Tax=Alteromonas aestuariivivens TaxID=1938339 RepID=A0A3D8MBC6_9ALTE|nr:aminodeoxychorismate/anthranilate synthase component II [Alteromonas aestuariivivens]RDV26712.1 aminodeoxychorismate/anthranilate synthase component II [Alteromonas aestuariivivens]
MLLLIDNFDSFTHNLARYFVELGEDVEVVRNHCISLNDIQEMSPDHLVISPGPCTPNEAGISLQAIQKFAGHIPLLGVCLGHQAIGQVFGAKVVQAKQIRHGKVSPVAHSNSGLCNGLPNPFNATRYHSLVLEPSSLPGCLQVDAWCEYSNGYREIMAISHRALPVWGVQFHPESLLTECGHELLARYLKNANSHLPAAV